MKQAPDHKGSTFSADFLFRGELLHKIFSNKIKKGEECVPVLEMTNYRTRNIF